MLNYITRQILCELKKKLSKYVVINIFPLIKHFYAVVINIYRKHVENVLCELLSSKLNVFFMTIECFFYTILQTKSIFLEFYYKCFQSLVQLTSNLTSKKSYYMYCTNFCFYYAFIRLSIKRQMYIPAIQNNKKSRKK